MFLGRYIPAEKVWITVCCHKFETGEEYASTVAGWYIKVGAGFGTKVSLTFNLMDSETGIYYAEIDTTSFDEAMYMAVVEATINGVNANCIHYFEVRELFSVYI